MKGDTEVILMIAFFFAGVVLGNGVSPNVIENIFEATAALAAAFFGAHYAFKLQNKKAEEDSIARNVQAANAILFELIRTHKKFLAIQNQFINPHLSSPSRHLLIMPAAGISVTPIKINYDSLAFIFQSDKPNTLGTLSSIEQEIFSTVEVIERRSHLHYEQIQPIIEKLEIKHGTQIPMHEIEKAIGSRFTKILKDSTDYMIEGVASVIEGTRNHIQLLNSQVSEIYPGHRVIKMEVPSDDDGNS